MQEASTTETNSEPANLEDLLERLRDAAHDQERVSVDRILEGLGRRSFGPILLLAGLITLTPVIGDIPGVPTIMAALVILITGQLLFRRKHIWLPGWLLHRSVERDKLCRTLHWLDRPASFVDRFLRPRLTPLTHDTGAHLVAVACLLIAAGMPPMELVPFSANGAGAALALFGLGLIARDGLLVLVALALTAATFGFVAYGLI